MGEHWPKAVSAHVGEKKNSNPLVNHHFLQSKCIKMHQNIIKYPQVQSKSPIFEGPDMDR